MATRKKVVPVVIDDEPQPICDICGEPDLVGRAEDGHWLTPNWNGETGNHISCESKPVESVAPKFSDFDGINVPLAAVRMEISQRQKEGLEYMPLSDFLLLVHKCVKENN